MANKTAVDPKTYTTDFIKSDFDETSYLGNPHIDTIILSLQALGGELWTARRRLNVVEALLEKNIPVSSANIQGYVPTASEEARWKIDRDRLIDGMYEPFLHARELKANVGESREFDPNKQPESRRRAPAAVGKPGLRK